MNIENKLLKRIIEGVILASSEPVSIQQLKQILGEENKIETKELKELINEITQEYIGRGFELTEVASGYRMQVCADLAPWISKLWVERSPRYSRALLETLALIAYKQPITRAEIEDVRGVAVSSNIIRTLMEREWIKIVGHKEVPGRPALFATTPQFLDYFNLKSLGELPTLEEPQDLEKIAEKLGIIVDESDAIEQTGAQSEEGVYNLTNDQSEEE